MHYADLNMLVADRSRALAKGPIALVLCEDDIEVATTLSHLEAQGFASIVAFCEASLPLPEGMWHRVDMDVTADNALPTIINAVIGAAPGIWLHYCYNAEFLFYPFCETRRVGELVAFAVEERRDVLLTYVIDLYARDLATAPLGVDREAAYLDRAGYYALSRADAEGAPLDRQMDFYGGLRWRFEEHVPYLRRRIDRMSLFRAVPGLQMDVAHRFNLPEHNTYACPWHHSLTAAICSFRTAKALKRNPGSRDKIDQFYWQNSVRFDWHSQQLCDLGLMEPGQWF